MHEVDGSAHGAFAYREGAMQEDKTTYNSAPETLEHIRQVAERLEKVCTELRDRGVFHDASKLGPNEKPYFDEMTPKLKTLTYGTEEYKASLKALGPALENHYRENSHHPEHYGNGIAGFDLLDLVEMYCDWAAASLRSKDGDMAKGLEISIERFKIEPQLASILRNTWARHGGFAGYTDYHLCGHMPDDDGRWTTEIDVGTGQHYRRRPKPNAPLEHAQRKASAVSEPVNSKSGE
jgi:hypothetical protein